MSVEEGPQRGLSWREWLPCWERPEKLAVAGAVAAAALQYFSMHVGLVLLALLVTTIAFAWSFVKWATRLLRRFIWNLRNRLVWRFCSLP